MIERGIFNTKSDYWIHLFPLEYSLYWYHVDHMREWIETKQLQTIQARSKDGTVTGMGKLARKDFPFVVKVNVPETMIQEYDWSDATDREKGMFWGERIVWWMAMTNRLRIGYFTATRLDKRTDQYELGDFGIQFAMPRVTLIEVKTETVRSNNLFVQTHEGGHRVHQKKTSEGVREKHVAARKFDI